jgi:uncharacterized protein (UPF0333 family)
LANDILFVETLFYKHIKNQIWKLLLLVALIVLLFIGFNYIQTTWYTVTVILILFLIPLLAATFNTWFSFKAYDKRKLRFEPDVIYVGELMFKLSDLTDVKIYLRSYYDLRLWLDGQSSQFNPPKVSEYGNKNELAFTFNGQEFVFVFLLRNASAYMALLQIVIHWQEQYAVKAKCQFSYEEIASGRVRPDNSVLNDRS